ncbi:MAG: DUF3306 domain-containing protein [Rhodobacteraceae bacterium]|nr:DUF3306 domain-containing protein [Paracoccaceae bacterium]
MSAAPPSAGAWARRRAGVQAEAEALARGKEEALITGQHAALAEKTEEEVLTELDLPNPDAMQPGDDFSAFMKAAVPDALRNRALRTLWRSDPVLANVDMLVDYGEDFTGKNDIKRVIKTIYQVGKGMLREPVDEPETPKNVLVEAETAAIDAPEEYEEEPAFAPLPEIEEEAPAPVTPRRRMRFHFADDSPPAPTETEL